MRASTLRRRLALERTNDVDDDMGGIVRTWLPEGEVFAAIERRSRREIVKNGRPTGYVTHDITLRFRPEIGGNVRFVDGTTTFRVLTTELADARGAFLRCLCEEEQE